MSTNPKAPGFTILAGIGLSVLILLAWVGQLATLSDLSGSDPAGNALAQAFGALEIIVLWGLLAVLALLAATKGAMPRAAALAIIILIPASGFAAMTAAELLTAPDVAPFIWPIIIPALGPPLIVTLDEITRLNAGFPHLRAVTMSGVLQRSPRGQRHYTDQGYSSPKSSTPPSSPVRSAGFGEDLMQ